MARYFPSPVRFWIATIIILFTTVIYIGIQEYNDIKTMTRSINNVYSIVDRIESTQKENKVTIDKTHEKLKEVASTINPPEATSPTAPDLKSPETANQVPERRIFVHHFHHHYIHRPYNPVGEFLNKLFHH